MKRGQLAIIKKDMREIIHNPQVFLPLLILPIIMMVLLPAGLLFGAAFGKNVINGADQMIALLGNTRQYANEGELLLDMGINYMLPGLYLLIPMMCASVIAASSFISEKEHKTFESLMYTRMALTDLFTAKVVGSSVVAYGVALISAALFGLVIDTGGLLLFHQWLFPNTKWLVMILWVSPAVILFCVSFMVMVSARAKSFQEAQQMAGLIVLPVVGIIIGQSAGLFLLNSWILLGIGVAFYAVDVIMLQNAMKRYTPEKLM